MLFLGVAFGPIAPFIVVGVYFLPFTVAWLRGHRRKGAIFALNLCAGWTGVCWLFAIFWAFSHDTWRGERERERAREQERRAGLERERQALAAARPSVFQRWRSAPPALPGPTRALIVDVEKSKSRPGWLKKFRLRI